MGTIDSYITVKELFDEMELMVPKAVTGLIDPSKSDEFVSFVKRYNNEPENLKTVTCIEFEDNKCKRFRKMRL